MTQKQEIQLGYEVGSGDMVVIPARHLAITGQTQEAGKTTTLEALIARSGLRAVTFITKPGEASFTRARRIAPYFREQTDWQFVASILEASRGEKLKFERAWIIRASRGARTLADVHTYVRKALAAKSTGKDADVYTVLDAYLEVVVPLIQSVRWATSVQLAAGVNVMDLGDLALEMQHLVIRSTLAWVLEKEQDTVVIVPEAWKFIPQARGTPVKLAAESLIRQGAARRNYIWLDSQDLGGIDKTILRSVHVWLLGVQREANEIKRTLDNIPATGSKPKKDDIALLKLGQFFACWGDRTVKTYVRPAWMPEAEARAIARAPRGVESIAQPIGGLELLHTRQEDPTMCTEHQRLQAELERVTREASENIQDAATRVQRLEVDLSDAHARAGASIDLVNALRRILPALLPAELPALSSSGAVVDEDAIVRRVLARIPAGGGAPITVTPPAKLRKEFQLAEAARLVGDVAALKSLPKQVLRLLVGVESRLFQKVIAERLGRATVGGSVVDLGKAVRELGDLGLVDIDPKKGVIARVNDKVAEDLAAYQATEAEVDDVVQNVVHALATEA